ncbi:acyl-CoA dehydrogenase family protein [Chelatococcus asaccharovorans]|uniref:Pimeloyl-CoA dehydrogenase small subunit n=1 Tax=Chelatococcus asaccharovorans TaxID=28210 RepID=A0A2V3TQC8_9HYPH|nr:acyl-CoA dehydrogenase family protein [Chelatococcus asaccharovorans]MBS7707992.1 acyl-CoA dehydrogenase family protein [Chelatococcus asaccharovorans]PXW50532.1 pimeloyl-CoA dehydrogenase small subunit [Chelatococcus asaccharovorans]
MNFDLTPEQMLLKDSIDRLIASRYSSLEKREAYRKEPLGFSEAIWAQFAELGLLGLPFSEEDGGFGGGPVETMVVMEALGRGLSLEPYLTTVVLGGGFLRHAGSAEQKAAYIPEIVVGNLKLALAQTERQARYDLADIATTAEKTDRGYVIDGQKSLVLAGDSADLFVVSARTSGEQRSQYGVTLFLVDANTPGISRRTYSTQDGGRATEIEFSGTIVSTDAILGPVDGGYPFLEHVIGETIAALSAEAVGAMESLHQLTVEYLKTRKQFGVSIGSFQTLQHRAVDMLMALEQARSMEMYAAMMVGSDNADERRSAISAAKVQINRSARFVGQEAVQLHGGIGMTMEYIGAHYFKRLTMIESLFGDTAHHLHQVARVGGLVAAA